MGPFDKVREALFGESKDKLESALDQPKEDIDLCSFVKNKVEEVRQQSTRVSHEGIWMTNIAYLLGFDSVYYDPNMRQFRPVGQAGTSNYVKRNRIHSNLILPGVQNRLARMLKAPPKYDVRPNTTQEEDKEAAKLGIEVINLIWDKEQINRKRIDLGMWKQQCGHSYVGVCYDDEKGEPLIDPQTEELEGYEGDLRVDVVSAFEGFADPLAKTFEECSWFARAKVRKLDYFRSHYPERGELVKEEGVWLLSAQYEMRINTLNTVGSGSSGTAEQMKNAAIEISYYEKRSRKYPNGRHIVTANGVLLKNGQLPVGEIPYAKFDDVVVGGKYYSESLITHVRPLQDQYNRTLVKRADWVNKLLAGKYIAARGHGLMQEGMNDQSGEIVEYDPVPNAAEPHALTLPVIPSYAYEESKTIKSEIYEILGLSEVSRGNLPSASIPAMGIQLLLEQDETRMGIETEQDEHSWARVGMLILKYVDKYYITSRKLKTKGKNLEYDIKEFTGGDLKRNFDVTVIRGSTVPNSKVVHRQEILNLYGQGLLGNPTDPSVREKVLGMLQYGDVSEVWKDQQLDETQIQRDIKQMENGEIPPVNEKDNHVLHLLEKNRYRKGEKFLALPPEVQEIFEANIEAHMQEAMKQANPALAMDPNSMMGPPPPPEEVTQILNDAAKSQGPVEGGMPAGQGV